MCTSYHQWIDEEKESLESARIPLLLHRWDKKALWRRGLFQYLAPVEGNCFQMNELIMLGASTNFILCSQKLTFMAITSLSKQVILDIKVLCSITEMVLLGREIVLEEFLCCNSCNKYT